ncbi:NACHT domain-containing protein, partial [candidate division KSB1 bacterium]
MKSDRRRGISRRSILLLCIVGISVLMIFMMVQSGWAQVEADSSQALHVESATSIGQWIKNNAVLVGLLGIVLGAVLTGLINLFVKAVIIDIKHKKDARHKEKDKKKVLETEEDRYLDFVITENEKLAFHGFESKVRVPVLLWDVYVPLRANMAGVRMESRDAETRPREEESRQNMSIEEAVKLAGDKKYDGLIILGDPGAGKTTLMKYFALSFAKKEATKRLKISGDLLPVLMPLRNVDMQESFTQSICRQVREYNLYVSEEFFRDRLEKGRAILLLDGLDEVADEASRIKMCEWIHKAQRGFSKCPFIITSRFSGYRGEVRLPGTYLELNMLDFTLEDVQQFLHSWYTAVEIGLNEDNNYWRTRARNAAAELYGRIAGNANYVKLAINPLMLQLIALVHYDFKTVPDRRVELYQKCVDLLLQKWDEAKGLKTLLTAKEARQVLQPLALWLHSQENRRQATYEEILAQMAP